MAGSLDIINPEYHSQTLDNYWSPAQIRLYIAGVWIDDACAVRYQITDHKTPKFGYNDRHWRTVAQGRTVVQGQLSINYRYNGYLRDVVEDLVARRKDFEALTGDDRFKLETGQTYEDVYNMDIAARLEWIAGKAASAPPEIRQKRFDFFKKLIWGELSDKAASLYQEGEDDEYENVVAKNADSREATKQRRSYQRPGLIPHGFDIMMVAGTDPGEEVDPALTRTIEEVHLTGEHFVAEIAVPDGGRALREVYNFIARRVVAAAAEPDVSTVGGARSG